MDNRRLKWIVFTILSVVTLLLTVLSLFARQQTGITSTTLKTTSTSSQGKITWAPSSTDLILPPGESTDGDFTFTSSVGLQNAVIGAVPEIAGFLSVQPNSFASIPAGQMQSVHVSFFIPAGSALGTHSGTIHVRIGNLTLPQTLKVSLNVVQRGMILTVPSTFQIDSQALSLGGPVSLTNFAGQYQEGGIVPPGGAEIDIPNIPFPTMPLSVFIANELQGATITSTHNISVSGSSCTEESYTDSYGPTLTYSNIAVYCSHGGLLYKLYLSYRVGDALETEFLTSFQQI